MHAAPETTPLPLAAARAGDPEAWDLLFRRYQLPLFAYVMGLIRNEATTFDLIQESFLRALRNIGTLRDDRRFAAWLFGIAHQLVVLHWRRQGRTPFEETEPSETWASDHPGPDEALVRADEAGRLLTAIDSLPEAHRGVVLLHFLEDLPLAEIAEIQGVSLGTVKSRLHYAKRNLRARLTLPTERR